MSNKFKLKRKLISIALALVLAAQPLASFPMNVFAGTGKNSILTAPRMQKKTVTVPISTTFSVPLTFTVTFIKSDPASFPGTGTVTFTVTDTVTGSVITIASGTFTVPVIGSGNDTLIGAVNFTGSGSGTVIGTVNFTGSVELIESGFKSGSLTFTGNLSVPGDLMVPVDVTARVTDNSIDIQAQPQPPAAP